MNLVLIGYRGTGKSTIGKLISTRLGMDIVSTDELIIERAGMRIPEIVAARGWDAFRDMESTVIRDVAAQNNLVIDAGGGVVVRDENVATLRKSGIVFWLTAPTFIIAKRIQADTERPSLTGNKSFIDEIEEVLKVREPLYRAAAHQVIDTTHHTLGAAASEIIKIWENLQFLDD